MIITSSKSIGYGGDDEGELFLSLGQLLQNAPSCLLRDVQEYGNDTSTYRDGHPASTLFLSCFLALDCMCLSMPYNRVLYHSPQSPGRKIHAGEKDDPSGLS